MIFIKVGGVVFSGWFLPNIRSLSTHVEVGWTVTIKLVTILSFNLEWLKYKINENINIQPIIACYATLDF